MRGSGTQKFVYQKWPDKIFPMADFVFPSMVTPSMGGGFSYSIRCSNPPTPPKVRPGVLLSVQLVLGPKGGLTFGGCLTSGSLHLAATLPFPTQNMSEPVLLDDLLLVNDTIDEVESSDVTFLCQCPMLSSRSGQLLMHVPASKQLMFLKRHLCGASPKCVAWA